MHFSGRVGRRFLAGLLLAVGFGPVSYGVAVWEAGNFHPVSPGKVYRSRQLGPEQLTAYAREYGIKSVLNLRGENPDAAWYREERLAALGLGLRHYDYGISANRELTDRDIETILAILRDAPKPILIHCRAGADRSSLVAALNLYRIEGRTADEAGRQLSVWYGHVPFFGNSTAAMDRTFRRYTETHPACQRSRGGCAELLPVGS